MASVDRILSRCVLVACAVLSAFAPCRALAEDEPETRTSEELIDKYAAWRQPGFRLALSFGYEKNLANHPTPASSSIVPSLHLGWRFSERFELSGTLRYSVMIGGFLEGLRFSGTLEAVWHVSEGLSLTGGLGYAVLVGSRSYDYPEQPGVEEPLIEDCNGDGVAGLLRVSYLFRVGHLFATGPALQLDTQLTWCTDQYQAPGAYDPSEGPETIHRWWGHTSTGLAWVFAWR
jgi:hypothetical protein